MRTRPPWIGVAVVAVILLAGLGFLTGGVFGIVVRENGTPAKARIVECHLVGGRYRSQSCIGAWVTGGRLVGGGGHVVTGTVEGAGPDDVGRTIDVRLAGDRAYTRSLRVPIILLVLALGFLAAGIYVMRALLRQSARRPAPPPPAG